MVTTRSISRSAAVLQASTLPLPFRASASKPSIAVKRAMSSSKSVEKVRKRKAPESRSLPEPVPSSTPLPSKKAKLSKQSRAKAEIDSQPPPEPLPLLTPEECHLRTTITRPDLPFNLTHARNHLCSVDPRFGQLFETIPIKTYEEVTSGQVKEINLFKSLASSIIGQQISWLAARSVIYKFCRLFDGSLPEVPDWDRLPRDELPFPLPTQVIQMSDDQLRSAGLSGQKVKYIKDVAQRFSDGRLDVREIVHLSEEECIAELVKIKGVGRWTAEMLLMFSLRRPDVLPVGDLGVQRGMVHFHCSDYNGLKLDSRKKKRGKNAKDGGIEEVEDAEQVPPGVEAVILPELPAESGLTMEALRSRANGKKIKGNLYMSPDEMLHLSESWRPYRSVATMFMWAIID
ncbi:DNA glycosylase [Violaceomyces palustris]|uniref:DNA glycosylase n=1 Tax=Violaceomyces palustris TaxID=1673888 RepID=A0ACD0P238_9BASI|nr:DNA glycosylase [Violaceomyces palustris]